MGLKARAVAVCNNIAVFLVYDGDFGPTCNPTKEADFTVELFQSSGQLIDTTTERLDLGSSRTVKFEYLVPGIYLVSVRAELVDCQPQNCNQPPLFMCFHSLLDKERISVRNCEPCVVSTSR